MKPFVADKDPQPGLRPARGYMWIHLCTALALSTASHAASAADTSELGNWLMGQVVVVALLGACAWAVVHVLRTRKRGASGAPETLRVIGSTALGARERAVMLQAGERVFLLGVTAQTVSVISELNVTPAVTQGPQGRGSAAAGTFATAGDVRQEPSLSSRTEP
jgi:flagellar protein FliO/FliZ